MLDLRFIRENPDQVRLALQQKRGSLDLDQLLEIDQQVQTLKRQTEEVQAARNANAKAVGSAPPTERAALVERGKQLGQQLASLEPQLRELEQQLRQLLYLTPTLPWPRVPVGPDDSHNLETRRHGEPPQFDFAPLDHIELMQRNGWADFERAARVAGTRSYILRGDLMRYEQAVLQFALDQVSANGFIPMSVPSLAREEVFYGHGQFPTARDQVYEVNQGEAFLA